MMRKYEIRRDEEDNQKNGVMSTRNEVISGKPEARSENVSKKKWEDNKKKKDVRCMKWDART